MGGAGRPTLRSGTRAAGSIASASLSQRWADRPGQLGALPPLPCSQRWADRTRRPLRFQEWHPWVLKPGDLWSGSFSVLSSYFVPGLTTPKAPSSSPSTSPMPRCPGRKRLSGVSPTYIRALMVSMCSACVASVPAGHSRHSGSSLAPRPTGPFLCLDFLLQGTHLHSEPAVQKPRQQSHLSFTPTHSSSHVPL